MKIDAYSKYIKNAIGSYQLLQRQLGSQKEEKENDSYLRNAWSSVKYFNIRILFVFKAIRNQHRPLASSVDQSCLVSST